MSTPVNMANVTAMGAQFKENVFKDIAKGALTKSKRLRTAANRLKPAIPGGSVSGAHTTNFRTTQAGPRQPVAALPAGSTTKATSALSSGVQSRPALPTGPRRIATPFTPGATPYSNTGSNAPALPSGKYRGIATPYSGGNRIIPMSSNAA